MRQNFLPALAFMAAAGTASAQTNFATYVALGDSLSAGVVSSSLVVTHQNNSFPALIARQAGVMGFQQPTVAEPGSPPELVLVSLLPVPVIAPKAATPGGPTNGALGRSYNNLGVPGATSVDCLTRTTGGAHDLVLRGRGTQVQQAVALRPTFITLWIGSNDVLAAAVSGRAIDGLTLTPAGVFRQTYQAIVDALRSTGAPIVAANLPDVTSIPFVTTIPPVVVNPQTRQPVLVNGQPVPLIGPTGPLPPGSFVTLAASSLIAQGIGVSPAFGGNGRALPDEVILDTAEVATIRDRVNQNNLAIAQICAAAQIPVVDMNELLREVATTGRLVGGVPLTSAFLTGGIFSYDGVHPSELGYALVANEFIRVINERGGSLPYVDLGPFTGIRTQAASAGAAPFGILFDGPPRLAAPLAPAVEFTWEAYQELRRLFPPIEN